MLGRSFQHGMVSFPCLLRPCLSLDMTSDAVHRLMLPSQRTLQIMAAVDLPQDEGTNKIAPRAPCGLTIHCMVFNVFVHLCLWTGCDVHLPGGEPSCPDQCAIITRMVLQQPNGQHGAPSLVAWMIFVADIFLELFSGTISIASSFVDGPVCATDVQQSAPLWLWHSFASCRWVSFVHGQPGRQRLLAVWAKHCTGQAAPICSYRLHGRLEEEQAHGWCDLVLIRLAAQPLQLCWLLPFTAQRLGRPDLLFHEPTGTI